MQGAAGIPVLDEVTFRRITELVYQHTGIRIGAGKEYFLVGRLGRLFRTLGCSRWEELCLRLETGPEADLLECLVQAVVTGETRFFRDHLPFQALAERVVPEALARQGSPARLKFWSAGCSTGQEPYSIAFSLWDAVERGEVDFEVWATDLCKRSLRHAGQGVYGPYALSRGLPPEARSRFFEEQPEGYARVRAEIRSKVRFEPLNLLAEEPSRSGFHAVFCRNVAIYFDRHGKERLYRMLCEAVLPGGYLVFGAAEPVMASLPGFEAVQFGKCLLFRKKAD